MKFCNGGEKMTIAAVTGVKMRDNDISSIKRVSRKFPEVPRCSRTKRWQRNVQKRCAARAKLLFCQLGPILVFFLPFSLPSPLSITRFYILFEQTINSIGIFAFRPG